MIRRQNSADSDGFEGRNEVQLRTDIFPLFVSLALGYEYMGISSRSMIKQGKGVYFPAVGACAKP